MSDDTLDLRDLLGKPAGDYPDKPDLPANRTFYGKIISMGAGLSSRNKTPYFRFNIRLTDPGKDVTDAEIEKIRAGGFSLADYDVYCDFWITKPALPQFRRFQESLGFPTTVRMDEVWKLNPNTMEPTEESNELVRGRDVICRTGKANETGKVFSNLDSIAGVKRE